MSNCILQENISSSSTIHLIPLNPTIYLRKVPEANKRLVLELAWRSKDKLLLKGIFTWKLIASISFAFIYITFSILLIHGHGAILGRVKLKVSGKIILFDAGFILLFRKTCPTCTCALTKVQSLMRTSIKACSFRKRTSRCRALEHALDNSD